MRATITILFLAVLGLLAFRVYVHRQDDASPATPPSPAGREWNPPAQPPVQDRADRMLRDSSADSAYEHFQKLHVEKRLDEAGVALPDLSGELVILTADSPYQKVSTEAMKEFLEIWQRDREKLITEYLDR